MKKFVKLFKKFHNENKGVTLVELIIAVTILSISVAPLLYSFVYSTRFNAKSKVRQRSTAAAQTVMENFKAYDMEDINKMFTEKTTTTDADGNVTESYVKEFLRNNTADYSFTKGTGTNDDDVSGTYTISGMSLSDVSAKESAKYDAVITVTPGLSIDSLADVDVYDPTKDGLWQETYTGYGSAYFDPYYVATEITKICAQKRTDNNENPNDVTSIVISRDINLILTSTSASVIYSFPYTVNYATGSSISDTFYRDEMPASDSVSSLRNVYFYYYPAYIDTYSAVNSDGTSSYAVKIKADNLTLKNTSGNDKINVFIYKQIDSTKDFADLKTSENNYYLHCYSKGSSNKTNLYDCIQANLANVADGDYDSSMRTIFPDKDICTEMGLVVKCDDVGPSSSGILTYNIDIKIYRSDDVATNGLSKAKLLEHLTGSVTK